MTIEFVIVCQNLLILLAVVAFGIRTWRDHNK